jgi:hypothetical protein
MGSRLFFGDEAFDNEFINMSMWDQLGKIEDSDSAREVVKPHKFKPINSVLTDDGVRIVVTPAECARIKNILCSLRTEYRGKILRDIQYSKPLNKLLEFIRVKG